MVPGLAASASDVKALARAFAFAFARAFFFRFTLLDPPPDHPEVKPLESFLIGALFSPK